MLVKRNVDEMITHFNDVVSAMDISIKDKMTILGMITAIGYEYQDAADAIEELQRRLEQALYMPLPRWIPVTERLPEAGERVLCYCRANIYEVMKMRTDGDWVYDTNHVYMHSFVTHWMLLPQPPKEET